jgi:ATP-binding cassette subfamily B protein
MGQVITEADLISLVESLPDGLQTRLGEGGALVSGGEGQRVRLGRALLRRSSRLVILDEPFTALDREIRHELLCRARDLWAGATLLCATHDIRESLHFDRVLVVEGGRIVEDGHPSVLEAQLDSRYRLLLEIEKAADYRIWSSDAWRALLLKDGRIIEQGGQRDDIDQTTGDVLAGGAARRSLAGSGVRLLPDRKVC